MTSWGKLWHNKHRFMKIENAYTIDLAYLVKKASYILQVINGKETKVLKSLKE